MMAGQQKSLVETESHPGKPVALKQRNESSQVLASHVSKSAWRFVFSHGNMDEVSLEADYLLAQMAKRGLVATPGAASSAIAAIKSGHHVALISESATPDFTLAFGELLCDCAALAGFSLGWLCLHGTAGALIGWDDLVQRRFTNELWLFLANPSGESIARVVHEVRDLGHVATWRFIAATSLQALRTAELSPAERRLVTPVAL